METLGAHATEAKPVLTFSACFLGRRTGIFGNPRDLGFPMVRGALRNLSQSGAELEGGGQTPKQMGEEPLVALAAQPVCPALTALDAAYT